MERRDFIRLSLISAGIGMAVPTIALAESDKKVKGASDIYYMSSFTTLLIISSIKSMIDL